MSRLAVVVAMLITTQARAAEQLHLAMPGLTVVGMPAERGTLFNEHLASSLVRAGVRVSTANSIREVLGIERQRQLLGCSDSGCDVELASALGADGIVTGQLGVVGSSIQVNVKVISARSGDVIETLQERVPTEEAALDALDAAADRLAASSAARLGRELRPTSSAGGGGVRRYAWAPAGVGVAAGITGAVLLVMANGRYQSIPQAAGQPPIALEAAQTFAREGQTLQTAGWVAVGVGAAALAGAGAMFLFGGAAQPSTTVSFWTGPDGAGVVIRGAF